MDVTATPRPAVFMRWEAEDTETQAKIDAQIAAEACKCWSCDGQCGNSQEYCGPLAERAGHQLCAACRDQAAALDVDRQGISIKVDGDRLVLGNAWDVFAKRYYLDRANVLELMAALAAAHVQMEA